MNPVTDYIAVISEIVAQMRLRGLIISITENSPGEYTSTLSDYDGVEVGRYVDLGVTGLDDVKIKAIPAEGQMVVQGEPGIDVSGVEKYIRKDPYFYKDRSKKIIEALLSKNNSYFSGKMFPSVELVLDDNEFEDRKGHSIWRQMTVVFCERTNKSGTAEERNEDNFIPILRPNYFEFKRLIEQSNVVISNQATFNREEFYGEIYSTQKNAHAKPFYVDAILARIDGLRLLNLSNSCNIKDF